jgi:hypothetical protein
MIEPRAGVADCLLEMGEQGWWLTCSPVIPCFVRRPAIVVGCARSSELIKVVIRLKSDNACSIQMAVSLQSPKRPTLAKAVASSIRWPSQPS